MKRFRLAAVLACLAALATGIWFAWSPAEPVYNGQPISHWIEMANLSGDDQAVDEALAGMGEPAVRWLMDELRWKPSSLIKTANQLGRRFGWRLNDRPDRRYHAARALGIIGPKASTAIPALEAALKDPIISGYLDLPPMARWALFRIRSESVSVLVRELDVGSSDDKWRLAAETLAMVGKDAAEAVPLLVLGLNSTNSPFRRTCAIQALRGIASRPEDCLPQLINLMRSNDSLERRDVLDTLRVFGPQAEHAGKVVENLREYPAK